MNPWLKRILSIIGFFLLAAALLGDFTSLGTYPAVPPRPWEQYDAALSSQIHSLDSAMAAAEKRSGVFAGMSDEQKMLSLYDTAANGFTGGNARHTFFSNWILWLGGQLHPALGSIYDADLLVARGHSLICSQSSYVLVQLALRAGIRARHVGLNGHVVMEAWYGGDWHLFDPDMEVVVRDKQGNIFSLDDLARSPLMLEAAYSGVKSDIVPLIASRQDNTFMTYPAGTYFEWKSEVLRYNEKIMQILKYVLPILFILYGEAGWMDLFHKRQKEHETHQL